MPLPEEVADYLRELPKQARAGLAVELIDSLGEENWEDAALGALAEERDAELESGAVAPLSYDEFLAGLRRVPQAP